MRGALGQKGGAWVKADVSPIKSECVAGWSSQLLYYRTATSAFCVIDTWLAICSVLRIPSLLVPRHAL